MFSTAVVLISVAISDCCSARSTALYAAQLIITVGLTESINCERISIDVISQSFSSGAMTDSLRACKSFENCLPSWPLAPRMRYV